MRAGGWKWSFNHKFDGEMVVKIISSAVHKIEAVYLSINCAGADGNTCGRKSRGDEKQLIDLEWPNTDMSILT